MASVAPEITSSPRTLADLLPDDESNPAVLVLESGGGRSALLTVADLRAQALRVLGGLREAGARPGAAVLLCLLDPARFLPAFWGCQLGGLTAVPLAPPMPGADEDDGRKLAAVSRLLDDPLLVCDRALVRRIDTLREGGRSLAVEELLLAAPAGPSPPTPEDVALIQFSSGSTGAPRGVRLPHRTVLANIGQVRERGGIGPADVEVGWMPLHHDMGLIACHLSLLAAGATQVRISPLAFLSSPALWLDVAAARKATLLTATTTALRLVLRRLRPESDRRWDLATVRSLFLGAEPISATVVREFAARFAACGLDSTVFRPAYGLAEACVGVAGCPRSETLRFWRLSRRGLGDGLAHEAIVEADALEVAEIGPPLVGVELRVVDDADRPLPDCRVGHVQLRGPNLMEGYHGDPEATAAAFVEGWLRTGDLGFLREGRLTICGRAKETLLVAGRNVYAADVEAIAAETPGVHRAVVCTRPRRDAGDEEVILFVVAEHGATGDGIALLEAARRRVQGMMHLTVDSTVALDGRSIPRTSSGKIRRYRLAELFAQGAFDRALRLDSPIVPAAPAPAAPTTAAADPVTAPDLLLRVRGIWAAVLGLPVDRIGPDDTFLALGGSSLLAVEVLARLEQELGCSLGPELVLRGETPRALATLLADALGHGRTPLHAAPAPADAPTHTAPEDGLAIVGLACRFPGASNPAAFWRLVRDGRCAIGPPGELRWRPGEWDGIRCRAGGFLLDPYAFDPDFFGFPASEAALLDPQQRLLLELATELLEETGWSRTRRRGATVGVFVGASPSPHVHETLAAPLAPSSLVATLGNMVAARLAHVLDLGGPVLTVDTACSSSLVALHLAGEALRRGECRAALVGGASLPLAPLVYRLFEAAGALSPTGRCRPFAADADGFVPGEGAGLLLVRRLADAQADGDPILALVRGSAVNNDGRGLSPMAPRAEGQRAVLTAAWSAARIDPASLAAVEAHGTGTVIGDGVELAVLARCLEEAGASGVAVSSVKAAVGHLLAAAGMAGLIKMVLALGAREIPPAPYATEASPRHPLGRGALRLPATAEPWPGGQPRRCGVSSLGFGGTNAHVVLEEAPQPVRQYAQLPRARPLVFALSAPTSTHLAGLAGRLAGSLAAYEPEERRAAAGSLAPRRTSWPVRTARLLAPGEDPLPLLGSLASGRGGPTTTRRAPRVALLFPGQGAQHPGQGAGLLDAWPILDRRFRELCGCVETIPSLADRGRHATAEELRATDLAQPLLVALQLALAGLLQELGVHVAAVLGHSVGELAAAVVAGALTAEETMGWVAARSRLMQDQADGRGGMLAVSAAVPALQQLAAELPPGVTVAALNSPEQLVLSGREEELDVLRGRLETAGMATIPLRVGRAFHSPAMEPVVAALRSQGPRLRGGPPRLPFASTVLGGWAGPTALDEEYWLSHVRRPVRFAEAFGALAGDREVAVDLFLDVGPAATLAGLARRLLPPGDPRPVVALCRLPGAAGPAADLTAALNALARLWEEGAELDWARIQPPTRPAGALPAVSWRRRSYRPLPPRAMGASSLIRQIAWSDTPADARPTGKASWVLIGDGDGLGDALADHLQASGDAIVRVVAGPSFSRVDHGRVTLERTNPDHFSWLFGMLSTERPRPDGVIWLADGPLPDALLRLAALGQGLRAAPLPLLVVTTGGQAADTSGPVQPDAAAAAAWAAVLIDEERLTGRVIDVAASPDGAADRSPPTLEALAAELRQTGPRLVALRDGRRRVPGFAPAADLVEAPAPSGAWLITGGLGGIGRLLAVHLARGGASAVLLAGRRPAAAVTDALRELVEQGVPARYEQADLSDLEQVSRIVALAASLPGGLEGVVHAAGVASRGRAAAATAEELATVLRPKVDGARCLAAALADHPGCRLVLLSSVAGTVPRLARGTGIYGAANAWLDALAHFGQRRGLPWLSLSWGLWHGVGMGAAADVRAAQQRAGTRGLLAEEALAAWDLALSTDQPHLLIAPPETLTPALASPHPEPTVPARTTLLPPPAPAAPAAPAAPVAPVAPAAPPAAPPAPVPASAPTAPTAPPTALAIEAFLRDEVGRALLLPPATIDPAASFASLGIDSLMAVEIGRRLEAFLGRPLPATLLFEHDRITSLASLLGSTAASPPPGGTRTPAPPADPPRSTTRPTKDQHGTDERDPPPGSPTTSLPVLPTQATFLIQQSFAPEIPCSVLARLDVAGPVAPDLLDRAWELLFARHEMLRVTLRLEHGRLLQQAGGFSCPRLERATLAGTPARERAAALAELENTLRQQRFDPEKGPLFKAVHVDRGEERSTLLLAIHHAVADATSTRILLGELFALHRALRRGEPPPLPPLPTSFADCVAALTRSTEAAEADSLRFWEEELSPPPPRLALPWDGDPDAPATGPAGLYVHALDHAPADALRALARSWDVTPFQVLLTGLVRALRRLTGQEDLLLRVAHDRRDASVPGIESIVGSFADSLPVRVRTARVDDGPDLARRLRRSLLDARRHAGASSLALARLHRPEGVAGPRGLSPVGVSFPGFTVPERFEDLEIEGFSAGSASGFTGLGLVLWERRNRYEASWSFLRPRLQPGTVERIAACFEEEVGRLLAATPGAPDTAAPRPTAPDPTFSGASTLRTGAGRALPRHVFDAVQRHGRGAVEEPTGETIPAAAIVDRALRTRTLLGTLGLGRGDRVGLLARASAPAVSALLGISAAGAAWVALDPDAPDARLHRIAAHAGLRCLACRVAERSRAAAIPGLRHLILLDGDATEPPAGRDGPTVHPAAEVTALPPRPPVDLRGSDPVWVLYTSGTTGEPKGVIASHEAAVSYLEWVSRELGFDREDRFLQLASLGFGASVRQLFTPLTEGATGCPAPPGLARDPATLVDFVDEARITVFNSVPTVWRRLMDGLDDRDEAGRPAALAALRHVLIGGEILPAPLVRRWLDRFGDRHRLVNLYGGAETLFNALFHRVTARPDARRVHVPVGRPRPGVEVLLVDQTGRATAPGETGELLLGGPHLALGYLDAPAATAAAWVERPEGRFFRTGDLARYDEAGDLVVLGRSDSQVKIRGNRVELGEVEAALRAVPGVADAVVAVIDGPGRQTLVAWILPTSPAVAPGPGLLRESLARQLPAYMIPHRFVTVESWPQNANGKVDRRELAHRLPPRSADAAGPPPATPTEHILAAAWQAVLGLEEVGIDDDFFALGGDSLLALDLLGRLRGSLPVLPRPITLHQERTIRRQAQAIDALAAATEADAEAAAQPGFSIPGAGARSEGAGGAPDATAPAAVDAVYVLSPAQTGFLLLERLHPGASPVWVADVPLEGAVDPQRLARALTTCCARHPALRTVFVQEGSRTRQRVLPTQAPDLPLIDLRERPEREREAALAERSEQLRSSAQYAEGRVLFSATLGRVGETSWRLLVAGHHALGDGWSLAVLLHDLLDAYEHGQLTSPPPRTTLHEAFAHLADVPPPRRAAAGRFWESVLSTPPPRLPWPTAPDGPRSPTRRLGPETMDRLRGAARELATTPHTLLLTAFFRAVAAATGVHDLLVATAISGRDLPLPDTARLVGPFALALPVRVQVGSGSLAEELETVAASFAASCAHADVPAFTALPGRGTDGARPELAFTFQDLRSFPPLPASSFTVELEAARTSFDAAASGARLLLAAVAGEQLRLTVHGDLPAGAADELLDRLIAALEDLPVTRRSLPAAAHPRLDSAIVAYLPALDVLAGQWGVTPAQLRAGLDASFPDRSPCLVELLHGRFGVSGAVLLPLGADEIAALSPDPLAARIAAAVRVAAAAGARAVSLAGMLPSRTGGLALVLRQLDGEAGRPALTTGHAATVAAIAETTTLLLDKSRKSFSELQVGVVGFGSIGQSATSLLLDLLGPPARLRVCDLPARLALLGPELAELEQRLPGRVELAAGQAEGLPDALYACDLLIGASAVGGLLAIDRLRPGTLVADDSFPPLGDHAAAIRRMEQAGDVLVAAAGCLDLGPHQREPGPGLPPPLLARAASLAEALGHTGVPGCRAESMLVAAGVGLAPVHGLVSPATARRVHELVRRLGGRGARLHLGSYVFPDDRFPG